MPLPAAISLQLLPQHSFLPRAGVCHNTMVAQYLQHASTRIHAGGNRVDLATGILSPLGLYSLSLLLACM